MKIHLQLEPIGTPGALCRAACGDPVDDLPSQLSVGVEFITCPRCIERADGLVAEAERMRPVYEVAKAWRRVGWGGDDDLATRSIDRLDKELRDAVDAAVASEGSS